MQAHILPLHTLNPLGSQKIKLILLKIDVTYQITGNGTSSIMQAHILYLHTHLTPRFGQTV